MLMAKNADICSKCLVTEPWVRSFTARSFAQRFNCSNSEYDRFQRRRVPVLRRREKQAPCAFLLYVRRSANNRGVLRCPQKHVPRSGASLFDLCLRRQSCQSTLRLSRRICRHVMAVAATTAVVAAVVDCGQLSLPAMASGE
jgi:hypothetical protein